MNKDVLLARANAGDTDAMVELIGPCMDDGEVTEAIDWADKAAEQGNTSAIWKAVFLHSMRMHALVDLEMLSGVMRDDAKAVQENAAILIGARRKGLIELDNDMYSSLVSSLRDGIYFEAVSCYYTEPNDWNQVVHLLEAIDTAREQFLCGYAYFELNRTDDALKKWNAACQDGEYLTTEKKNAENGIFSFAMRAYSAVERIINGDLDKAVMILNKAINGSSDGEMKEMLRKELGRY